MSLPQPGEKTPPSAQDINRNEDLKHQDITISPFYHSAVNSLIEPNRYVGCSLYFVQRWMPLLGNEGVRIIFTLRALGYYNPKTGERRDHISIEKAELADLCGCSERTIARELSDDPETGKPRNWALAQFVQRRAVQRRNKHTGRVWQEANQYQVAMDDPVHPDDWPKVAEYVAKREENRPGQKGKTPERQNGISVEEPVGHFDLPERQYVKNSRQSVTPNGQNGSPLKSLYSESLRSPSFTPAAHGVSLSLLQEQETVRAWAHLTKIEQQPYRAQAEQELIAIFGLGEWGKQRTTVRDRQVQGRAETLYKTAQKEGEK